MRSDSPAARLAREVTRFESELGRIANELVAEIIAEELSRASQGTGGSRPSRSRTQRKVAALPSMRPNPPRSTAASGKTKSRWSRENVISELGKWLLGGSADAAFVKRHGPPGLVAAAKRYFGRFEAALNAANLAISDQVAAKRRDRRQDARALPTLRELAWQQQRRQRGATSGT